MVEFNHLGPWSPPPSKSVFLEMGLSWLCGSDKWDSGKMPKKWARPKSGRLEMGLSWSPPAPGHRPFAFHPLPRLSYVASLDGSLSPRSDNPSRTEKVDSRALQKLISVVLWKYCSNQALSPKSPPQDCDEKADRKNVDGVHRLRPEPSVSSLWPHHKNADPWPSAGLPLAQSQPG